MIIQIVSSILTNLADGWYQSDYIQYLENQTPISYVIPFGSEHPEHGTRVVHAFVYKSDNKLHLAGNYDTTNGWTDLYSFSLQHQPIFNPGPMWNRSLWGIDEDASRLRKLEETVHNHIKEQFGGIPIPSEIEFEQLQQIMEKEQRNCNCNTLSSLPRSKAEFEESESMDIKHIFCNQCRRHHAIERDGKRIPDSTLFDPNWILNDTQEDVFPVSDTDDYIIYDTSDEVKRIDHTVDALAWVGGNQNREFTIYDPTIQDILVYVYNDIVAGYLSIRQLSDYDILHQLYIRPSMRGNGFATSLIEAWNAYIRETDTYLLDEPNEASYSIVQQLGHRDLDSFPRALPASRIESFWMHD